MPRRTADQVLTKRAVDELLRTAHQAAAGVDAWLGDKEVPGFIARCRRKPPDANGTAGPAPRVDFFLRYRVGARRKLIGLGRYGRVTVEQARRLAREKHLEGVAGRDPAGERARARLEDAARELRRATVREVAEDFFADLERRIALGKERGRRSTLAEWRRLVRTKVPADFLAQPLAAVEPDQVEALHRLLAATPSSANRLLTCLSAIFTFAERRKIRPEGTNPTTRRRVTRYREAGRRVGLSVVELARLGEALRHAEARAAGLPAGCRRPPAGAHAPGLLLAVRLAVLTGMRRSELVGHEASVRRGDGAGLRWGDVDLEAHVARLRIAKGGARDVVLGRVVVDLLRRVQPPDVEPGDAVCASPHSRLACAVGLTKVTRGLFDAAGIVSRAEARKDLHSLRHTFGSAASGLAVPETHVKALLGHAIAEGATARYVHPERGELHRAADRVAAHLASILDGTSAEVLSFRAAREEAAS